MSQQSPKNNPYDSLRINALLSMVFGLRGEISQKLRAASIKLDKEELHLFFYYDGPISEEDHESAECVATEVIADFPEYAMKLEVIRLDYPNPIPSEGEIVYCRRES